MATVLAVVQYVLGMVIPNSGGSPALKLVWADVAKIVKAGLTTGAAAAVAYTLSQLQVLDKTNASTLLVVTILTGILTAAQRFLTDTTK